MQKELDMPESEARSLARILDASVRVPGTQIYFGLDSVLGLVPGIGDLSSGFLSTYIIVRAYQRGVPRSTLTRMILNVMFDTALGTIPIIGDLGDIFWKANTKNIELWRRAKEDHTRGTGDIIFLAALLISILAFSILCAYLTTKVMSYLASQMGFYPGR
ncbi:DUF4112 domain-containing protein [Pseudobacteriovorax antillogorgiicola]|nr:DUF4112 domain-containing protein [Pseudobacteriovorax antillogorgiicola]